MKMFAVLLEVDIPAVDVWQHSGRDNADADGSLPRPQVAVDSDDAVGGSAAAEWSLC